MNMISIARDARFLHVGGLAGLLLLCACAQTPDAAMESKDDASLPPPIISSQEVADPAVPPSYEVGIATAAADRNRARENCAEKSERLKAMCEAEVDAQFASAEDELQDLRGNQQ